MNGMRCCECSCCLPFDSLTRSASKGELGRFAQKFGGMALLDRNSKRFAELGLAASAYSPERWVERMVEEPMLLRMPLVRNQNLLTIGPAEPTWREWVGKP